MVTSQPGARGGSQHPRYSHLQIQTPPEAESVDFTAVMGGAPAPALAHWRAIGFPTSSLGLFEGYLPIVRYKKLPEFGGLFWSFMGLKNSFCSWECCFFTGNLWVYFDPLSEFPPFLLPGQFLNFSVCVDHRSFEQILFYPVVPIYMYIYIYVRERKFYLSAAKTQVSSHVSMIPRSHCWPENPWFRSNSCPIRSLAN